MATTKIIYFPSLHRHIAESNSEKRLQLPHSSCVHLPVGRLSVDDWPGAHEKTLPVCGEGSRRLVRRAGRFYLRADAAAVRAMASGSQAMNRPLGRCGSLSVIGDRAAVVDRASGWP